MRLVGPPERCARLRSGEEVCSWKRVSLDLPAVRRQVIPNVPNSMHHVVFVYDPEGIARTWHYSGTWGQRSSTDTGDSGPPQSEAVLP
jgi:hypothetical protein